jgi:hypothetical protein
MVLQTIALLSLALSSQGGQRLPGQGLTGEGAKLFRQVITAPTGANGYEEYVEAAALLKSDDLSNFQKFERWLSWSDRFKHKDAQGRFVMESYAEGKSNPQTVLAPEPPAGLTHYSTFLDLNKAYVARFGGVIPIVERGNRKQVFQPRQEIGIDTLLPEIGPFRELGRMFVRRAEVEFASGSTSAGTNVLLEGLRFSRNLSSGVLINSLAWIANAALMLYTFEKMIGRLSLSDANAVLRSVNDYLKLPPAASDALKAELALIDKSLESIVAKPQMLDLTERGGGRPELIDQLAALQESQRKAVQERARVLLKFKFKEIDGILAKPESQWHLATSTELPISRDERDWLDSLAGRVVNSVTPNHELVLGIQARSRAQLRCLRASARVVIFKWENGRLPTKIEEAVPEAEIEDPASGGRLRYLSLVPWTFIIESPGWGKTGSIGIRYRRPAQSEPDEPTGTQPPPK